MVADTAFLNLFLFYFESVTAIGRVFPVDKTTACGPVFAILGNVRRLVIRPGAIGDFVVSLPAMECLTTTGYCEVWAPARAVPLVRFAARPKKNRETMNTVLEIGSRALRGSTNVRITENIV